MKIFYEHVSKENFKYRNNKSVSSIDALTKAIESTANDAASECIRKIYLDGKIKKLPNFTRTKKTSKELQIV